jgi:hypothetical protein
MPYVESPLDRIVGVNFGTVQTFLNMSVSAALNTEGPGSPPQYSGTDLQFVMTVSTVNLPLLDRTTLQTPTDSFGGDSVFGSFPDEPTGVISGNYSIGQPGRVEPGEAGAGYQTDSRTPFYGTSSIAITITFKLREINPDGDRGYRTSALAVAGVKSGGDIVRTLEGIAPGGATIVVTATLDLVTSVLSLVGE